MLYNVIRTIVMWNLPKNFQLIETQNRKVVARGSMVRKREIGKRVPAFSCKMNKV